MNIHQLMKQAQKMQKDLQKKQSEFSSKIFDFNFHNDLIKISITGNLEIKKLVINKDLVDPNDCDTLEDLLRNSINEAIAKVSEEKEAIMPKMPGAV